VFKQKFFMKAALAGPGRCVRPPPPKNSTIKPSSQMNEKQKGKKKSIPVQHIPHTRNKRFGSGLIGPLCTTFWVGPAEENLNESVNYNSYFLVYNGVHLFQVSNYFSRQNSNIFQTLAGTHFEPGRQKRHDPNKNSSCNFYVFQKT
jgi:hypothetical protein